MAEESRPVQWFHGRGRVRKGPYQAAELSQLIATGAVLATDLVWRAGFIDWVAVNTVAELNVPSAPVPAGTKPVLWFYGRNGVQKGPFSPSEMAAMTAAETLLPADLVWKQGFGEWLPASRVAELMGPVAVPTRFVQGPHWYYGRDSARQGPFSEMQMRDFAAAGTLKEMDWVWREGLPEWAAARRFPEIFQSHDDVVAGNSPGFRDPRDLTLWLKWLLIASIILGIGYLGMRIWDFAAYTKLDPATGADTMKDLVKVATIRHFFLFIPMALVGIAYVVLSLQWTYRTSQNARALGARDMKISPGWCVGWNFVPLANFVMPVVIMREIWRASKDHANWQTLSATPVLGWWWFFNIANWVLAAANGISAGNRTTPALAMQNELTAIATVLLSIITTVLVLRLYQQISGFQCVEWARQCEATVPPSQ